ncbi:MAG: peptidoglycan-associated lipoprotein Pal [Rubrivivax sp.]
MTEFHLFTPAPTGMPQRASAATARRLPSFGALLGMALLAACSSAPIEPPAASVTGPGAGGSGAIPAAPERTGAATAGMTPAQTGNSVGGLPAAAAALAAGTPRERSVYFDFDNFTIDPADQRMLAQHAKVLVAEPTVSVRLEGHADDRGSKEYNLALGQRRAEAVKRALSILGVREQQMRATSWGEEKPQAAGESEYAWSRNRRAEIVYAAP